MGDVWRAVDQRFPRDVAIKFGDSSSDESARRQSAVIEAEASNGARLVGHQNIVPVLDYGVHTEDTESIPYLVMALAPGPTLESFIESLNRLTDTWTRDYVSLHLIREVCEAIMYSHELEILHRDIKPANVLITNGVARVTDFGLSRVLGEPTRKQTVRQWVSPLYAAPEQYNMEVNPTTSTDVYQLAATAYQVITGRPVFPNDGKAAENHKNREPQLIRQGLQDWQFPHIAELLFKMLAKDPLSRPELWALHDELAFVLVRPWRLKIRDVADYQRSRVAMALGFEESTLINGVDHIYADDRVAFRQFMILMMHGFFVGILEGLGVVGLER